MDWNWPSILVWFGSCGTRYHGFGLVDNLSVNYNLSYGWKWWHCRDRILRPPPLSSLPFFTLILLSIVFLHKISSYEGGNLHSNINCVSIIHVKHGCSPLALSHTYIHTHTRTCSLSFLFLPSPSLFPPVPSSSPSLSPSLPFSLPFPNLLFEMSVFNKRIGNKGATCFYVNDLSILFMNLMRIFVVAIIFYTPQVLLLFG